MFKGVKLQWKLDWFDFNLMWPKFNKNLVMPNLEMEHYRCIISNCKAKIQGIVLQLCLTCVNVKFPKFPYINELFAHLCGASNNSPSSVLVLQVWCGHQR